MGIYKGCGGLTREQFLFYETRIVAKLIIEDGLSEAEIINKVAKENLFQFPTERMSKNIAKTCLKRLHKLNSEVLVSVIARSSIEVAKQACLYAMMRQYRLVWDYMITVVGQKFRGQDFSYSRMELNIFFLRLQEQDDDVALWADSTIQKIKQVLNKILIENNYLDGQRATRLNSVLLYAEVENAIRDNGDEIAFAAFNYFD